MYVHATTDLLAKVRILRLYLNGNEKNTTLRRGKPIEVTTESVTESMLNKIHDIGLEDRRVKICEIADAADS